MEYLIKLINDQGDLKIWSLFKFKNHPTLLSHLIFAYDILIFSKATPKSLETVKNVLHEFFNISGMTINAEKSKIWSSKPVLTPLVESFI